MHQIFHQSRDYRSTRTLSVDQLSISSMLLWFLPQVNIQVPKKLEVLQRLNFFNYFKLGKEVMY